MKNKIYVLILTFILVLSGLSDLQADPFVWACGRYATGGSGCIMTYLQADSAYNLCSDDTLRLYATKSDDAATSYQWYERYTYQSHSSIPPWYIDGPIEAETMRELVITKMLLNLPQLFMDMARIQLLLRQFGIMSGKAIS